VKLTPERRLTSIAALNSCTHTPVEPVLSTFVRSPSFVAGPKTPFAMSSLMPSSNWTASRNALCTSREYNPSQGTMKKSRRCTYRPLSHCWIERI
jgi:hypothetical protein